MKVKLFKLVKKVDGRETEVVHHSFDYAQAEFEQFLTAELSIHLLNAGDILGCSILKGRKYRDERPESELSHGWVERAHHRREAWIYSREVEV